MLSAFSSSSVSPSTTSGVSATLPQYPILLPQVSVTLKEFSFSFYISKAPCIVMALSQSGMQSRTNLGRLRLRQLSRFRLRLRAKCSRSFGSGQNVAAPVQGMRSRTHLGQLRPPAPHPGNCPGCGCGSEQNVPAARAPGKLWRLRLRLRLRLTTLESFCNGPAPPSLN